MRLAPCLDNLESILAVFTSFLHLEPGCENAKALMLNHDVFRSHICDLLKQSEISHLSLSTKLIYRLVRPILYRNPQIESYASLTRFQRTITQATWMGKVDHKWSSQDCIDQTKFMDLLIDPNRDSARNRGQPPAAVMISRMLQAIARYVITAAQ